MTYDMNINRKEKMRFYNCLTGKKYFPNWEKSFSQLGTYVRPLMNLCSSAHEHMFIGTRTYVLRNVLVLVMMMGVSGVWGQVQLTTADDITNGTEKLYWIESKGATGFFMIPHNNNNNPTNASTSNMPNEKMLWYFMNAENDNDKQYYYIVNKSTQKYLWLTGTLGNDNTIQIKSFDSNDADKFQFSIKASGNYWVIYPKDGGESYWVNKKSGNVKYDTYLKSGNYGGSPDDNSKWSFVAKNDVTWAHPFTNSTNSEKHYYLIQNANPDYPAFYMSIDETYAAVSVVENNKRVWYFEEAEPDATIPNLKYYHIVNASTGKYMYFNSNTLTGSQLQSTANAVDIRNYEFGENEDRYLFAVMNGQGTSYSAYSIVPKKLIGLYDNKFNTLGASSMSNNQHIGTLRDRGADKNSAHWNFVSTTFSNECDPPTISYDEATNTVTMSHSEGATIYYTTDGSDPMVPTTGTTTQVYGGSFQPGSNVSIIKAIASKLADGSDKSEQVVQYFFKTITSTDGITDMNGAYRLAENFSSSETIGTAEAPFKGVIDGNYNAFSLDHALIGVAENATIKNVVISSANVSGSGNVGALVNTAKGTTRIYNCGVQGGSVSGGANVGGLVGLIQSGSKVRVVNCYNYANVSGSSNAAGIVGKNEGTVGDVRIALCMMYGNVTTATNISPVYTGNHNTNVKNFTEYNYYLYSTEKDASGNRVEKIQYTAYNDQMAIDKEEYLTRFPFYRHILNTHRELAAYFLFDDHKEEHVSEIGHWFLKKGNNVPKYLIIEKWLINTKRTTEDIAANLPNTTEKYAGKLLTDMGSSGYLTATVVINDKTFNNVQLPITDMDTLRYDFTYGKVVLPHANEFDGWTRDYSKICTGWKITKVGSSTSSSVSNYNFADRDNPQKDVYDDNNPYIFAQGGNYIVPYNVSSITIEANFANAFYLSDPAYDMGYDSNYGTPTELGGGVPLVYHDKTVYTNLSTLVNALAKTKNPHVQAIVLVGNFHYNMKTLGGAILNGDKAVTIMSVDEDCNQEPDYGWYSYMNNNRPAVPPLRFDFVPNIPIGMSSHVTGSTTYPAVSIWKAKGWFELTETCVSIMNQCEIDSSNFGTEDGKGNNRWIANSGCFTQIVRSFAKACTKLSYIQIGGNAYVKELYPGNHSEKSFTNTTVPIVVTGGEIEECCMTGYHVGGKLEGNNIYFWCAGGRIHKFLGAYMETPVQASGQTGGVNMNAKIDHARIWRFFGGGTTNAATISGNISVTINNSLVDFYCGGPEFGDMVTGENGKTVTTNAIGTTFRKYYGAGFGGTSFTNVYISENNSVTINSLSSNNGKTEYPQDFTFYTNRRLKTDNNYGIGTAYKFEYIIHSEGAKLVARWYIGRARFSLATTGNVVNNLTNCIVEGDFYGAGCQGKVDGTVTSTLTNCEVRGSAFGGGYKAANNAVSVYPTTQPTYSYYNCERGIFSGFGTVEPETWNWKQGTAANETYDSDKQELYTQSSITLSDLGNVTGAISLTIDGGYVGGTSEGETPATPATETTEAIPAGGSVYGGGNESKSLNNTTVTLKGDAIIYGNVFGGGNEGEVSGTAKVNIDYEEPTP